jgi:flagellar biosynthetic protein FlhB
MGKQRAPIILAKGMDNVALKIIEVASKHDIPSIENKPLARGLYEAVEINQEIPETYYHAVAEVLAFVYQLKKGEE